MATVKKEPELPLEPMEPRPESVKDIEFEVYIYPEVIKGQIQWLWCVENHTAKPYIGDFTSLKAARSFPSASEAEFDAQRHVNRVRNVVEIFLTLPEGHRIKL